MKMTAPQSLKFSKLKRRLAIPHWQAVGILESLWLFTQVNAPAGDIGKHSDEDIAAGMEWADDPTKLIDALADCGWIDRSDEHRIIVHDWEDHVPRYLKGALAKNGVSFVPKQPANSIKQDAKHPANDAEQPAPRLALPCLGNSNHTNPDGSASVGVGRRKAKTEESPLFVRFWKAYPRKDNRADAAKAFAKFNPSEEKLAEILAIIERQKLTGCLQPKTADDGRSVIPHASTWLNKKRWEDEEPVTTTSNNGSHYSAFKDDDKGTTTEEANALRARQGLPPIVLNGLEVPP